MIRRNKFSVPPSISVFVLSLSDFVFIIVFMLVLASGPQMLSIDSDLGRHLTIGSYILDHRVIPTRDLFSHTLSNESRPPYEWLSQVLFALANRLLGLDAVILLIAIIIAITFKLAFGFAIQRCRSPIIAFSITFLAIGASSIHWLPRPHIITFLLLAIWVEHLEQLRKGKSIKLVAFPLIMLLWANLHGGFVFGILAWFAYFAGWLWAKWQNNANNQTGWKLMIVGFTSLMASVITPDLWRNWEGVLNNRSSFILSRTVETMSPNLTTLSVLPFTFLLILILILFLANYKMLSISHVFLLTGLGIISLLMARNIPLFVIVSIPIAAELAKTSLSRLDVWHQIEKRFLGFDRQSRWPILPMAVILLTLVSFTNQYLKRHQTFFQFNPKVFPVQAMNWLEAHPQKGRMFNEFNWGGYILYRAWPQQQVFLDSQSDFYGEPIMKDYDQITSTKGEWEGLLGKYQVNWVIIPSDWALASELTTQGWLTIYRDQTATILIQE